MNEIVNKNENNDFGFVRFKLSYSSCYGSPALTVIINFASDDKVSAEFSDGLKLPKVVSFERAEAEKFLSKIIELIEKPETLSGLRTVNQYRVEIEWENLPFIEGEKSGKFSAVSAEWFTESIEYFMKYEAETTEIAERMQKILDANPHRHALEIYSAIQDFTRKYRLEK